jgi:molybdopterin-synthase adenylyltransferase
MFERNPEEREALSERIVAVIGCGSVGSAVAEMLARAGIGEMVLVDPDRLSEANLGRHLLTRASLGEYKVEAMARRLLEINPELRVRAVAAEFSGLRLLEPTDPEAAGGPSAPDLIVSAVDSYRCESRINALSLTQEIPTVYLGCWGPAAVGEIYYVVPGTTGCYECFSGFREKSEIPPDARRYTDPNFDDTRVPGQPGLWGNILVVSGIAFQVILGLLGLRPEVIDCEHNLWLFNVSAYGSDLQPLAATFGTVRKGCAVCDESLVDELTLEA